MKQADQFRALLNSKHEDVMSEIEELNGLLKELHEETNAVRMHFMRMYGRVDHLTQRAEHLESLIVTMVRKMEKLKGQTLDVKEA